MLAKVVNDNAVNLAKRGVLAFFASKLAPTMSSCVVKKIDHPCLHLLILPQPGHCTASRSNSNGSAALRLPTPYQSNLRVSTITVPSRPNSSNEPISNA